MKLDGNSLAGPLGELFSPEITTAIGICGSCGSTSALGEIEVYAGGPAMVLRCPTCQADWGYIGRYPDGLRLSLRGLDSLRFPLG